MALIIDEIEDGTYVKGTILTCDWCSIRFIAKQTAKYCSGDCRSTAHRMRQKARDEEAAAQIEREQDARLVARFAPPPLSGKDAAEFISANLSEDQIRTLGPIKPAEFDHLVRWMYYQGFALRRRDGPVDGSDENIVTVKLS